MNQFGQISPVTGPLRGKIELSQVLKLSNLSNSSILGKHVSIGIFLLQKQRLDYLTKVIQ